MCPDEGAILEVARWGPLLLYSSEAGRLHGLDLRAKEDAWVLNLGANQVHLFAVCPVPASFLTCPVS